MARPREITDEEILAAARRCFLAKGAGVSAAEIAKELDVSHTTLFNRFGSKEGLMVAALAPPKEAPWIAALDRGPDARPIRTQLVEHAKVISAYFDDLQAGFGVLRGAGVSVGKTLANRKGESPPARALRAFVGWIERAQAQGKLAEVEPEILAKTILGALQSWAFTARMCGEPTGPTARDRYIERFVELLWKGIGDAK
jgi:AcrR family transcriptional regulator